MGLYAYVDLEDAGFETVLEAEDARGAIQTVEVDYSTAIGRFVATFMEIATDLVPVRTGYLRSTIKAQVLGPVQAECIADCEYAEYVEYGTYRQDAQPYFTPALEQAYTQLLSDAGEARSQAMETLEQILNGIAAATQAAFLDAGYGDIISTVAGIANALLFGLLFMPIAFIAMEMESIFTLDHKYGDSIYSTPEVIII